MRHGQHGATLHQPVQRRLHLQLRTRVEGGGRLVQQHHGRVLEEGAGHADALALAAGEPGPALAHQGFVTVGQGVDEFVAESGAGGGAHLLVRGVRPGEADVLRQGAVEQAHLLRHGGDGRTQVVLAQGGDVLPVHVDAAALHVVEAQQQPQHSGLAGAGRPDQPHPLAGGNGQVHPIEHARSRAVAEAHSLEPYGAAAAHQTACVRRVRDLVGAAQNLQRLLHVGVALAHADERERQVARAVQQAEGQGADHHHVAGRNAVRGPQRQGEQQGHPRRHHQRHVIYRAHAFGEHPAALMGGGLALEGLDQALALAPAGGEGLHRPHVGDHVDQFAADAPAFLGVEAVQGPAAHAQHDHAGGGQGRDRRHSGRQSPVDGREDQQRAEEVDQRRRHLPGQPVEQRAEVPRHGGDAMAERPRQVLLKVAHGLAGEVLEQVGADIHPGRHRGLAADPPADAPEHRLGHDQEQEQS